MINVCKFTTYAFFFFFFFFFLLFYGYITPSFRVGVYKKNIFFNEVKKKKENSSNKKKKKKKKIRGAFYSSFCEKM